jgi:hypothetical protein
MYRIVLPAAILFFAFELKAQKTVEPKKEPVKEQLLDGTLDIMGHLGGKLLGELKTRMNLDDKDVKKPTEEVKVVYDFGLFKWERTEMRPKKD